MLIAQVGVVSGQSGDAPERPDFGELKAQGALRSRYRAQEFRPAAGKVSEPRLALFERDIEPILSKTCLQCHGPDKQKGGVRIDTLDPDLFAGSDVDWWLDVLTVLTNGEMPPEDEAELSSEDRGKVIEWLSAELQRASFVRRRGKQQSSFRRMTRYEYDYALQDLLGLPFSFGADLPPDPTSEDGFQNSSEVLHLTAMQLWAYLDSSRKALRLATVQGEQPAPIMWDISMEAAAAVEWAKQDAQLEETRKKHKDDPQKLEEELARLTERFHSRPRGAYYEDLGTGRTAKQSWHYGEAKFAWKPTDSRADLPEPSNVIAIIPTGAGLIVELGDTIPERGTLRVRVLASRPSSTEESAPSMRLVFGWQASNDSSASVTISDQDIAVTAAPEAPMIYQWDVPLSQIYPRNLVRSTNKLGDLPSPSEYIKLVNASISGGDVRVHAVDVTAPVYETWPPAAHTRILFEDANEQDESAYTREVLVDFISRAWRRAPSAQEVQQKLDLFTKIRPQFDRSQGAMIEVLATVLSSPNFLYLVAQSDAAADTGCSELELATRLSMFLWCSIPDDELRTLAQAGQLRSPGVLTYQIERMLSDPRSGRFAKHFVRQWLDLSLLDYLHVDRKVYPHFDTSLQEAMRSEPIALFEYLLQNDHSALEFIHSDFTIVNERLAQHYGLSSVRGNHFRRVELERELMRGGLLAQPGLLAMNSDGKDSHPLKRGIWLLERLLNDPPPPPPPAVPEIDLSDPEIAKMTLKQRIEDHRNHPACMSCHAKIDPWGIAFENFDAVGSWRTEVQGRPIDARSTLFNKQELDGMDGLKAFLLEHRQDQFIRALVHKLTTYALGRPLTFADRASIDRITAAARKRGDGLATIIKQIATSDLFQSR
jgi:hypothetical protein